MTDLVKRMEDSRSYVSETGAPSVTITLFPRDLDTIISALSGDGMGWRPIETAPKDDRFVLLGMDFGSEFGPYIIAGWYERAPADQCWYDITDNPVTPTHWMPLPASPALTNDKEG